MGVVLKVLLKKESLGIHCGGGRGSTGVAEALGEARKHLLLGMSSVRQSFGVAICLNRCPGKGLQGRPEPENSEIDMPSTESGAVRVLAKGSEDQVAPSTLPPKLKTQASELKRGSEPNREPTLWPFWGQVF